MLFKYSLKKLLTFNFIIVATLPIFIIGFVSLNVLTKSIKKEVHNKNYLLAKALSGEVERFLREPVGILSLIEDNINKREIIKPEQVNSYLASVIQNYKSFEMIRILDTEGAVKYLSPFDKNIRGIDMSGQPFYKVAKKVGKPSWSNTFISMQTGHPTLTVNLKFDMGMIVGYMSLTALGDIIEKVKIGTYGNAAIIDRDGTYIAHPDNNLVMQQMNIKHLSIVDEGLKGKEGSFEYFTENEETIGSVTLVSSTGWLVGVFQSAAEAFAPVKRIQYIISLGTLLAIALAGIMALFSIRKSLKPLVKFTEKTKKIAQGDYSLSPDKREYLEVDLLSDNFILMIDAVKKREDELRKTRNYVKGIFDSMPSFLVSVNISGKIMEWNFAAEKLSPIRLAEGVSIYDVFSNYLNDSSNLRKAITSKEPLKLENHSVVLEGEMKFFDIDVYPLAERGFEGAVIRIDDVTEKFFLNEMMVQTEKMMTVGGLAAGMAHEINNPLAGMMQNAQVALRRVQEEMPANLKAAEKAGISMDAIRFFLKEREVIKQLESIRTAGIRASKIVQNMLSFAKKDYSGKEKQNIALILDQTLEIAKSDYDLKTQYDFKKIEIFKEYDGDVPPVFCEVSKIQQVFFNILKNSAEAMQEVQNSQTPKFFLRVKKKNRFVCIEIEDNGPGMDSDIRKRVFEPFFTTKPVNKGTGLGLSVSYFIITDNHKGEMNVVSEPGKGTNFIIHLPIDKNLKERRKDV